MMIENNLMLVPLSHYRKWLIPFQDEKTREFIRKAKDLYGDKYDYSETTYINCKTKVKIYCKEHNAFFWQVPLDHLNGKCSCEECKKIKYKLIGQKKLIGTEKFIERSKEIHGDKYDYSEVEYINGQTKVKIFCKKHKEFFWQIPSSHLQGMGCERCGREEVGRQNKCSKESILKRLIDLYGEEYDFSKIDFSVNFHTPVEIICPIHGSFFRTLNNLLFEPFNKCCPQCNERFVCESIVGEWIKEHNISFQRHYKLINVLKLVDVVEIDYKITYNEITNFIEYNGKQHYELHEFFHKRDIEKFKDQLRRDEKVRFYCKNNNIRLIEIPYTINNKKDIFKFLDDVIINGKDPKNLVNYESLFKRPSDYIPYSEIENKDN